MLRKRFIKTIFIKYFFCNQKAVDTQTIPPPRSVFGANVLQWNIYDSYAQDFEQSEREKEKDKKV